MLLPAVAWLGEAVTDNVVAIGGAAAMVTMTAPLDRA
jgi:hypothetical protein